MSIQQRRLAVMLALGALAASAAPAQAAPTWVPQQDYAASSVGSAQISLDLAGDAFMVWKTRDAAVGIVHTQGTPWPAAAVLGPASVGDGAFGPDALSNLAVDQNGDAVAAWIDSSSGTVWAATSDGAGAWQSAQLAAPVTVKVLQQPSVGISDDGTAWVLWQLADRHGAIVETLMARRAQAGGSWSAPFAAPPGTGGPLVVAPNGSAFVFGPGTVAVDSAGDGSFVEEPSPVDLGGSPSLGADDGGNLTAVWFDTAGRRLRTAYRRAGAGWEASQVLDADPSAVGSRLVVTRGGAATVAFGDSGGVSAGFRLGDAAFAPQTVASGAATLGDLAGNAEGDAILSLTRGGVVQTVYHHAFDSFGAPEALPVVLPFPRFGQVSIDIDDLGGAYAAWPEEKAGHRARAFVITATRPAGGTWGSRTIMSKHWQPYHSRFAQPMLAARRSGAGAFALWAAFRPRVGEGGLQLAFTPTP